MLTERLVPKRIPPEKLLKNTIIINPEKEYIEKVNENSGCKIILNGKGIIKLPIINK